MTTVAKDLEQVFISALMAARGSAEQSQTPNVDFIVCARFSERADYEQVPSDESSCDRCGGDVIVSKESLARSPAALLVCTACAQEPSTDGWHERGRQEFADEMKKRAKTNTKNMKGGES